MSKVRLTICAEGIGGVDSEVYFDTAEEAVAWATANAPGKTVSIKGVSDEPRVRSRLVILESPYKGNIDPSFNVAYARRCLLDSLSRGEAPIASHLLYTQVLDDGNASQRKLGIESGLAWLKFADATVVYADYGVSPGMQYGIDRAVALGVPVETRRIE